MCDLAFNHHATIVQAMIKSSNLMQPSMFGASTMILYIDHRVVQQEKNIFSLTLRVMSFGRHVATSG